MRKACDLALLYLYDLASRDLDQLFGSRDHARRCAQRTGVLTLPDDLQYRCVAACNLADECSLRVGNCPSPATPR